MKVKWVRDEIGNYEGVLIGDDFDREALVELMWVGYRGDVRVTREVIWAVESDDPRVREIVDEYVEYLKGPHSLWGSSGLWAHIEELNREIEEVID